MSNGEFKLSSSDVSRISGLLKSNISEYKGQIAELSKLIETINQSASWKDENAKTAFINTCNSYVTIYKNISFAMEKYVSYLNGKSFSFSSLEQAYTSNTRRA